MLKINKKFNYYNIEFKKKLKINTGNAFLVILKVECTESLKFYGKLVFRSHVKLIDNLSLTANY